LNIYHARCIADQQITYVVEPGAALDAERLASAFRRLHESIPILSTRLEVDGYHFKRTPMPGYQPKLAIASDPADLWNEIVRFTSAPCDPASEAPLKLLLLRDHGQDTLCLKTDHVLSDAAGLRNLLYSLAAAYSSGKITQPINFDRGFGQVFRRFSPFALVKAGLKANQPIPGAGLYHGPREGGEGFIEQVVFAGSQYVRLQAQARQAGATLNDLLLAAVYQAVFARLPADFSQRYPLMVPVDMRRYLPAEERNTAANLASAVFPHLEPMRGEALPETLRRVKDCMDAAKREDLGLGSMVLMALGATGGGKMLHDRYSLAAQHGSRYVNVTNFGILDPQRIGFAPAPLKAAYGIGPIQYTPGVLIAVSTCGETLRLVVHGQGDAQFRGYVREFLDSISRSLA
jgi:NRPS condensation-like uncharacterized protein